MPPDSVILQLQRRLRGALAGLTGRRRVVAFSGGLDSTVLLHLAAEAAPPITALHINHGLHPQAAHWQEHCARICRKLGVHFLRQSVQVGPGNQEAAARAARYRAFEASLGSADLLMLAHHQDDQAETLLLRLLQGRGLLPMPPRRRLRCGALLLRPLLETRKDHLRHAAAALGLRWVEDPGNADPRLDRNYLRAQVLPQLRRRWPGAADGLAATAAAQAGKDALLGHLLDVEALPLRRLPAQSRPAALRAWVRRFHEPDPSSRALAEFCAQLSGRADAQPQLRLRHGSLRRWRGEVHYVPHVPNQPQLASVHSLRPPATLTLPHGELRVEPSQEGGFHAADDLQVRFRQGGEQIRWRGHTRSLKTLLQAAHVPPWRRGSLPLIFRGDELCAAPGIAAAEQPAQQPRWQAIWRPHKPGAKQRQD